MLNTRREFLASAAAASSGLLAVGVPHVSAAEKPGFKLKYIVGSCMYGYMDLATIVPDVTKTGSAALDIWPKVHGNQREQLAEMGEERFSALLKRHNVQLGCITQYKLGPFNLKDEMRLAARLGCHTMITGGKGPRGLKGAALKAAVRDFIEKMKPQLEVAAETGITIAIENHGNNLIESPDSLKWLAELRPSKHLGVALAPYHLEQDAKKLADLIETLDEALTMFYTWQHGEGCMKKMPTEKELLQMPGRGPLDFGPLLAALRKINYSGWTEIFMHHTPRGLPILETADAVTAEINRARDYLEKKLLTI